MRAMLVAAGFGTRLDPLTKLLPKPALPVGNRPIAWYALDHLRRSGVSEVVVNTHHLGERLVRTLEPVIPQGMAVRFVHEPEILGTGGGVRNAWRPESGEDFLTVNAKLLFAPDLSRALALHRERGAIATMILTQLPAGSTFTPIYVDGHDAVRAIGGEAPTGEAALQRRMYASVQILSERAFRDLPENGDIISAAYRPWIARGELVLGVTDDAPWMDVGVSLRHYLDANLALARGTRTWPGIVRQSDDMLVAPSAQIGVGCALEACVIGDGAIIAPGARLRRCVVWPGAHVSGEIEASIVMDAGQRIAVT